MVSMGALADVGSLGAVPQQSPLQGWAVVGISESRVKPSEAEDYFALWRQILTKLAPIFCFSQSELGKNLYIWLNIDLTAAGPAATALVLCK